MPWEVLCLERLDIFLEGDLSLKKVGCLRASLAIYNPPTSNSGLSLPSHLSRCEHAPVALDHLPPCLLAAVDCIPSSHVPEEIFPPLICILSDIWPQREFCLFLGSPLLRGCPQSVQRTHDSFEARVAAVCLLLSQAINAEPPSAHLLAPFLCRCSSTGISSRGLQATLHPGEEDGKFLHSDSLRIPLA